MDVKEGDNHVDAVTAEPGAEHKEVEDYEEDLPNPPENQESSSDSDGSSSFSTCQENQEFIYVELANIRKDVQCPICLGIIKKTRTVMECLHRFCRECIDKSMRMGNNECPACRTHCASRRSLRDDPNYDALIAALYPDIEKYEEEELTFHEEERKRNKQIQAAISQVFQRQEVLAKRGSRPQRSARFRRRRDSHDGEASDENGHRKGSTSTDEMSAEGLCRRKAAEAVNSHMRCVENDTKPSHTFYPDSEWAASEMLAWGGGGARSHSRSRVRNTRLCRLLDHLRTSGRENDELLHLLLVSEDEKKACGLQKPFICCSPNVTIKQLCQYIASQMKLHWEDIEMLRQAGPIADEVGVFKAGETLSVLRSCLILHQQNLKLTYRVKKKMEGS